MLIFHHTRAFGSALLSSYQPMASTRSIHFFHFCRPARGDACNIFEPNQLRKGPVHILSAHARYLMPTKCRTCKMSASQLCVVYRSSEFDTTFLLSFFEQSSATCFARARHYHFRSIDSTFEHFSSASARQFSERVLALGERGEIGLVAG